MSDVEVVWGARDVSLVVHPYEFVCIYGASGSGKSTLLNLLAGLDLADSGRVEVLGQDVGQLDESGRTRMRLESVGVVFQEHNLVEEFTALENVALPVEALGLSPGDATEAAAFQLARVGLAGLEARRPDQLSGGQRQRVGIARALVGDRRILLADEPTGALDSKSSADLFELLRKLCDDGLAAIVCSHDTMCREYADTLYEMIDGRLLPRRDR